MRWEVGDVGLTACRPSRVKAPGRSLLFSSPVAISRALVVLRMIFAFAHKL